MNKKWLITGAVLAMTGVIFGAFGAHGLKSIVEPDKLTIFETGVRYQMYHAFALLILGLIEPVASLRWSNRAGWFFLLGTGLFCGSLYGLTLSGNTWLGPITPLGGLCFILGWASLITAFAKGK